MSLLRLLKQSDLLQKSSDSKDIFHASHDHSVVVEASAGTGKTFALEELVLELALVERIPLQKILLVTFTEKATQELRTRLRTRLREIVEAAQSGKDWLGPEGTGSCWEIDAPRLEQLKAALMDFDAVPIYTIHGFCNRLIREFAFENRLLFNQQQVDTRQLMEDHFRIFLRSKVLPPKSTHSPLMNLYLVHAEGNLETLQRELLRLIPQQGKLIPQWPSFLKMMQSFHTPWKKLCHEDQSLRSSQPGSHPMREAFWLMNLNGNSEKGILSSLERIIELLGSPELPPEECFLHLLQSQPEKVTRPKCAKQMKSGKQYASPDDFPDAQKDWMASLEELERFFTENELVLEKPEQVKKILKAWLILEILPPLRSELEQMKLEKGVYDFDDMLRIVEENVQPANSNGSENPATPLTHAVRSQYETAIVDEFQDTDPRQWSIFKNLFLKSASHRLMLIGDPKQAIYGFRGAEVLTYLEARDSMLSRKDAKRLSLKRNFRSTAGLINGLNRIFQNPNWFESPKGIGYSQVMCGNPEILLEDSHENRRAIHFLEIQPHFRIGRTQLQKLERKKSNPFPKEMMIALNRAEGTDCRSEDDFLKTVSREAGPEITGQFRNELLKTFLQTNRRKPERELAETIAEEVKDLLKRKVLWHDGKENQSSTLKEHQICVLFRKTSEGEILSKVFRRHGIAYAFYKQRGLFQTREAHEILDLLNAVVHEDQPQRIRMALLSRFFGIPLHKLDSAMISKPQLMLHFRRWRSMAKEGESGRLFHDILEQTRVMERELFVSSSERGVTNISQILEYLQQRIRENGLSLAEAVRHLQKLIKEQESAEENDDLLRLESEKKAVQLMTMHTSKGLEFPVVFIFGGFSGDPPSDHYRYHDENGQSIIRLFGIGTPEAYLQEASAERQRLLYVALTRAAGRLYLPYVNVLSGNESTRWMKFDKCCQKELMPSLDPVLEEIHQQSEGKIPLRTADEFPFSSSRIILSEMSNEGFHQEHLENPVQDSIPNLEVELANLLSRNPLPLKEKETPENFIGRLKKNSRGFVVTSFSRMQQEREKGKTRNLNELSKPSFLDFDARSEEDFEETREPDETESMKPESTTGVLEPISTEAKLPGGVATGNFLHEMLERIDYDQLLETSSPEAWSELSGVNALLARILEKHSFSEEFLSESAHLVWHTLQRKIRLGEDSSARLAETGKRIHEMKFYFPLPDSKNPFTLLGTEDSKKLWNGEGWRVKSGFLNGSIDLVFEWKNRVYLLDWKSNLLENYNKEKLTEVVHEHYLMQLQIYLLATVRWLRLFDEDAYNQRFGGILYIFLRGMPNVDAVHFERPSWRKLKQYESELEKPTQPRLPAMSA